MANLEIDYRVEKIDRVHLGYAIANGSNFLLTSDKNLIKYRVPKMLEDAGFNKPETLTLEECKNHINQLLSTPVPHSWQNCPETFALQFLQYFSPGCSVLNRGFAVHGKV